MSDKLENSCQKILVVEDDPNLREALVETLKLESMDVIAANNAESAVEIISKTPNLNLIISDVNMGNMSGHDLLRLVKSDFPHIPMLLITAYASIRESVSAMKEGASDYLVKPFEPEILVETVKRFVGGKEPTIDEPIAQADSSRQLLQLARRVARSESTVLLMGESGTGKEVLAQYIHSHSNRSGKPFVAINCAAIPENMLEAILFGYEKGAYTGAQQSSPGKFEQANGGTILLDEISEMDLNLQAKLLRVLQEKEVEKLGGRKTIKLDVRVIATSNRDMRKEVSLGKFREDLYFRLSVLPLQWAPLRDRKEDILPLANTLLSKHAKKQSRTGIILSEPAKMVLHNYLWPGNVRELDNVMQRALILQGGSVIGVNDLGLNIGDTFSEKPSLIDAADLSVNTDKIELSSDINDLNIEEKTTNDTEQLNEISADMTRLLGRDMQRHEFDIIVKTLKQEHGSKKNTAAKLGISPRTLRYKIARLKDDGYNLDAALAT